MGLNKCSSHEIGFSFFEDGGTRSGEMNDLFLLVIGSFDHVNHREELPLACDLEGTFR
jgi:hypothetical protein